MVLRCIKILLIVIITCFLSIESYGFLPYLDFRHAYGSSSNKEEYETMSKDMVECLSMGINTDFTPDGSNSVKIGYEPGLLDAAKAAGFLSVRFFINYVPDPERYAQIVKDAIDRDLAVVMCMWAINSGKSEFEEQWKALAQYYKDYPDNLVFELFNEPLGSKVSDNNEVMEWYNAAIPAIRRISPTRTIIIGSPEWNHAEMMKYLTPEYLTYKLADGTGFEQDKNIIGAVHYYHPHKFTHSWLPPNGKLRRLSEFPDWKEEATRRLDIAAEWSKTSQKPVIMTEWGVQTAPNKRSDLLEYIIFMADEMAKRNIGSIYYCGMFSNEWGFSIFDSEWGWDQDILDILTGVKAPAPPPTSQLINSEFNGIDRWVVSSDSQVWISNNADLSGKRALGVRLTDTVSNTFIYQETDYNFSTRGNKSLLHLRKGNTYTLAFLAKAQQSGAVIKAQFENAKGGGPVFWTSNPVAVGTDAKEYSLEYTHVGDNVPDMRLTIMFEGSNNLIFFDKVSLKSNRND